MEYFFKVMLLESCRLIWDKSCSRERESLSQLMGRAAFVCLAETAGALHSPFASQTMMEGLQRNLNQHFFFL